jgi:prepilin-type N-terminal cleavage/methylation domain-containing protein
MKQRLHKIKISPGNRGFTLIELVISIMILVLIMLPLMNSFYRSAKMNKKAKELQEQSILTANLMEGLRNNNLKEIIDQFIGAPADFNIANLNAGAKIRMLRNTGDAFVEVGPEEYDTAEEYDALDEQAAYYFAIYGIKAGSTAYDALISMNPGTYRTGSILNNYPMPEAVNLDIMANGLLFSDGRPVENGVYNETAAYDSDAYAAFAKLGSDYAKNLFYQSPEYLAAFDQYKNDCETAEMNALPTPIPPSEIIFDPLDYPEYCDEETLKSGITKTMKITARQESKNVIQYQIAYTCNWPAGSTLQRTLQYPISSVNYAKPIDKIYLFYEPSIFKNNLTIHPDLIEIDNLTPGNALEFFLAKQYPAGGSLLPDVTIIDNAEDKVAIYTNIEAPHVKLLEDGIDKSDAINPDIVDSEQMDRIFNTDIKLYQYVASNNAADKFKYLVYTLSSATENTNLNDK